MVTVHNQQASNKQVTYNMSDQSLNTNATAPRFHVGEVVHTHLTQRLTPLRLTPPFPPPMITTVTPSVFGVIIDCPEEGTIFLDSETLPCTEEPILQPRSLLSMTVMDTITQPYTGGWDHMYVWEGVPTDAVLDQGSLWSIPHNERMYFVKWINKVEYPFNTQPTEFRPMTTNG